MSLHGGKIIYDKSSEHPMTYSLCIDSSLLYITFPWKVL